MTTLQKDIIQLLFNGHNVAAYRSGIYRVRDAKHNPVFVFKEQTYRVLKPFLRKDKSGLLVIDKNAIRQQRKNTWIKQYYKTQSAK